MFSLLRSLGRHQRLLKDFVRRDLKARYVGSSMGFFWSVIFPLINLFVYMFVFRLVLKVRWDDQSSETSTALVMLCGIMVWTAFAETFSRSTNCLIENANLIQKVVFPSEVLPPYLALSSLINMSIGLPVVLLGVTFLSMESRFALSFNPGHLCLPLLLLPVFAVLQAVFTVGLGYLFATLNLFLRDTYHVMGVLITVWMFATPIFYPAGIVKDKGYGWMLELNPMHWLIECYRAVLIRAAWPDWLLLSRFAAAGLVVFALGSTFFMSQKRRFPDLL